jgi:hypothetical protein
LEPEPVEPVSSSEVSVPAQASYQREFSAAAASSKESSAKGVLQESSVTDLVALLEALK